MHLSNLMNGKIQGTIVIGFQKLKDIPIIEIRNSINNRNKSLVQNMSLQFFVQKMGFTLKRNNFSLTRYERVKKIASDTYLYELGYSQDPPSKLEFLSESYDYIVFYKSEDLVGEFATLNYTFKKKSPDYLRKKQIHELVKFCRDYEIGKI